MRGIAEKAKADKQYRFRDIYRCLNVEFLIDCYGSLNKDAASGVDGMTWQKYAENLGANVEALVERLKSKRYRAKLIRRHYIPKGDGKERPLGIPVIEDKLLQAACARILTVIYEQDFLAFSYGYRPACSAKDAVDDLTSSLQFGCYEYVVEADIKGFFDHIDHDWLLKMLRQRIDDRAFLSLIQKWLKAGILETDGKVVYPDIGSPQGGSVSPVLANIYLHYALDRWFEKVVKPHCRGGAVMCRYADDWVCAFRFQRDADWFYQALPVRLAKFKLEVASEKTRILYFSRFHPSMKRRFSFLGFEFYWEVNWRGIPRVMRRTSRKKLQGACRRITEWIKSNRNLPGKEFFNGLNARLRGHYNYYGVRGNSDSIYRFFKWAVNCAFKWLNRRGGKRKSFTWEQFNQILACVNIARPAITEINRRRVFA
ncbi:MAG TPA: group II intron reverse transcriptase/maturase [Nitrospiraceae bacterium]|nr:group II intron reverse transcriptase/maturase [Nitrospiraceae bacterium]